jgi:hypothetical protein
MITHQKQFFSVFKRGGFLKRYQFQYFRFGFQLWERSRRFTAQSFIDGFDKEDKRDIF